MNLYSLPRYRLNVFLLRILGVWPYQSKNQRKLIILLWGALIATVLIAEVHRIIVDPSEEVIILDFTCCMTSIIGLVKWMNSIVNENNIRQLLELMQNTWSNLKPGRANDIMIKYADNGQKYCFYYSLMFYAATVIFLLLPMRPKFMVLLGLSEGPTKWAYPYYLDYWIDDQKYFYWLELHVSMGSIFIITAVTGPDLLFLVFMQHTCGMFAVICDQLEHIPRATDPYVPKEKDEAFWILSNCIKKHNLAIDFAVLLEETYCWVIFVSVCFNTLILTLSGIQMLNNLHNMNELIRYGPFMVGQVIHIFVENIIGQQLVDYSSKIDISIKLMNWYDISLRSQKLLNLMNIRSRVVNKITAGKIFVMSVEFFGSIIKTSLTYFTLLRSFKEE